MIIFKDIRSVRLETSTYCNAACPLCPRNLFGYPYNTGYREKHLSLLEIEKIFSPYFLKQLKQIVLEGNFGDPIMHPHLIDVIKFFKNQHVEIHTNASLQTKSFWKEIAQYRTTVNFALDGLEDTHSIYRQKTNYKKILQNAQTYINAGGNAVWKMIRFDHNQHQVSECRKLSEELGFSKFVLVDDGRSTGPVFDENKQLIRVLGEFKGSTNIEDYINNIESGEILIDDLWDKPADQISCDTINNKEVYINVEGEVYPCCFMGFNPRHYGKGRWHEPVNKQISKLLENNNALEKPIEECINWFNNIPSCWTKKNFADGRLVVCDANCGKNKKQ